MEQITKAKMLQLWLNGEAELLPFIYNAKIYAKTPIGAGDEPQGYKIVWCTS